MTQMTRNPDTKKTRVKKTSRGQKKGNSTKLHALLKSKEEEITELVSLLKKVQADFENYKKRIENELVVRATYANSEQVSKLLPLLDSFERGQLSKDSKGLLEGFKLIHTQLRDMLKQEGLEQIKAVGERFDPLLHEVLLKEHSTQPENIIIEDLQKGYSFKERVLRPSKVKISNGPQSAKEKKKVEKNKED